MKTALLLALLLSSTATRDYDAKLVDCYDGDTCTFDIQLGLGVVLARQTIRFCDINTPEIRPLATREEATKVRDNVLHLIKSARVVKLRIPQKKTCEENNCDDKGKYGRWLAYVIIDGNNLNKIMLDQGWAVEWKEKCLE